MPIVPGDSLPSTNPQNPMVQKPSDTNLMMALANMHEQGRIQPSARGQQRSSRPSRGKAPKVL